MIYVKIPVTGDGVQYPDLPNLFKNCVFTAGATFVIAEYYGSKPLTQTPPVVQSDAYESANNLVSQTLDETGSGDVSPTEVVAIVQAGIDSGSIGVVSERAVADAIDSMIDSGSITLPPAQIYSVPFVNATSVNVQHNFGRIPASITLVDSADETEFTVSIAHPTDKNSFVGAWSVPTTGRVYYS